PDILAQRQRDREVPQDQDRLDLRRLGAEHGLVLALPDAGARRTVAALDFGAVVRSEEHTSELQSLTNLVCRLLLEKKNKDQLRKAVLKIMPPVSVKCQPATGSSCSD